MSSADITEIFDSPIERVYEVLTDYKSYPDFVEGTDAVTVLEQNDKGAKVEFSLNIVKEFTYVLVMKHSRPTQISWEFESGDLFKKNSGSWTLEKIDEKSTRVHYKLDLAFKLMVPKMMLSKLVSTNLPKMMAQYKERAKKGK